jgi:hypothetical protein
MTDVPTTALTLADMAPDPTALTTGASPVTVEVGPRLYEVTSGGTGGSESIVIPMPDLPIDAFVNDRLIGLRITFCMVAQTDPADVVTITIDGSSTINAAAPIGILPQSFPSVRLNFVGATASFVWANDVWLLDSAYSDGDFDVAPPPGHKLRIVAGPDTSGGGGTLSLEGSAANQSGQQGGDIEIKPGPGNGARDGLVIVSLLPTSDPSVAGALWNNSGVLTVSAG